MIEFFNECSNIISLDFSHFDTSNVSSMECMFNQCHKLKEIKGINCLQTFNIKNMGNMFQGCYELESLNLINFDTSKVLNMEFMFALCYKLK